METVPAQPEPEVPDAPTEPDVGEPAPDAPETPVEPPVRPEVDPREPDSEE